MTVVLASLSQITIQMIQQYKDQIKWAVENKKGTILKGVFPVDILPEWQEFLNHMNNSAKDYDEDHINKRFVEDGKKLIGIIHFWGEFILASTKLADAYKNKDYYKKVINEIYEGELESLMSIVSITDWDKSSTRHVDGADTLNLQCIGQTRWQVCDTYEGPCEEFILSPGDVIFVPAHLNHEVSSIGPRANIIFGYKPKRPI